MIVSASPAWVGLQQNPICPLCFSCIRCCFAQVITQTDAGGHKLEPYEEAVVEVPEAHMGGVVDLMGGRKGQMMDMAASAEGGNRVTYRIPTRGLLGLRNSILTATKV
jgi:GTP-binding protein